jgi:hypothetical protein
MDDLIAMSLVSVHPQGMTFHTSMAKKVFGIEADEKNPKKDENYERSDGSFGVLRQRKVHHCAKRKLGKAKKARKKSASLSKANSTRTCRLS